MNRDDIIRMAREAGLYFKDDDMICEWLDELRCFAALVRADERSKLAAWMMAQGYATGHGETMEGLLEELEIEIGFKRAELWLKRINDAVVAEREAFARFFENHWRERWTDEQIVEEIRAWGDRL
jgi:hypothetical protein